MSQFLDLNISGLHTYVNNYSKVPNGSLSIANNIFIDRPSIAEPRYGYDFYKYIKEAFGAFLSDYNLRGKKLFFYRKKNETDWYIYAIIRVNSLTYKLQVFSPSTGQWSDVIADLDGFFDGREYCPVNTTQAKNNVYMTTDGKGVISLPDNVKVGCPIALDISSWVFYNAGGVNWLPNNEYVTYRILWGRKDSSGNIMLGAPSGATIIKNTSGVTSWIDLNIDIPDDVTSQNFIQVYRSKKSSSISNDELRLVYEDYPSAGQIAARNMIISDVVTDDLNNGAYLYTNESQQTPFQANYPPPYCADIDVFRDCMFYANTRELQTFNLTMVGLPDDASTITIGLYTYTCKNTPTLNTHFQRVTSFATTTENIRATSYNLISKINYNDANLSARYSSAEDDVVGKITIFSNNPSDIPFYLTASTGIFWNPSLNTSGTIDGSISDGALNVVAFSKTLEPEAVPLTNRLAIGANNTKIVRIVALKDSLFILKEDSLWRIYGNDPTTFAAQEIDPTTGFMWPDTVCKLGNKIFAVCDNGIAAIDENGVNIVSDPIKLDIRQLTYLNPRSFLPVDDAIFDDRFYDPWAVASDVDGHYTIFFPFSNLYYRYSINTNTWVKGDITAFFGALDPDSKSVFLWPDEPFLIKEDRTRTEKTYSDFLLSCTMQQVSDGYSISDTAIYKFLENKIFSNNALFNLVQADLNTTTSIITKADHNLYTGNIICARGFGSASGNISNYSLYYVIRLSDSTFQIATTLENAVTLNPYLFTKKDFATDYLEFEFCRGDVTDGILPEGSYVYYSSGSFAKITGVSILTGKTLLLQLEYDVPDGVILIHKPINTQIRWNPITFQNPAINKQVREANFLFKSEFFGEAEAGFESDTTTSEERETIDGTRLAPWGNSPWGNSPWGGITSSRNARVTVPRNHQRCAIIRPSFYHSQCYSGWELQGLSLIGNNISEKTGKDGGNL